MRWFEGNCLKFVPSKYDSGPEVLIPSFQPVNGERSELSTIEGRTIAIGNSSAAAREHRFAQALRKRIRIRPTQVLRAAQADAHQTVARPAQAVAFQDAIQFRGRHNRWIAAPSERLPLQSFRKFRALRPLFDVADSFAQRSNLFFGVECRIARRIVVILQLFRHAAVAHTHHVARREMHQPRVVALSQKVQQVHRGIHVGSESIAQVRIEIRQPRAVHHQIERFCQPRLRRRIQTQPRLAYIAFDDFHLVFQERAQFASVLFLQRVERRRFLDNFLKTFLRRSRPVSANQQRNLSNVRDIFE